MKTGLLIVYLSLAVLTSCNFSKSVEKDLITGLSTKGDGLSCENVYLSDGQKQINRSTFVYGESFYLNFENIEGFKKSENFAFPGMALTVIGSAGDTVLMNSDLYSQYINGIDISPLLLQSIITTGNPIRSKNSYKLYIKIWDKNGDGKYEANMDFDVVENNKISIESRAITYDEIYLFSQVRETAVTDDSALFNENIYMIFEGLGGFVAEGSKVFAGLSIEATDADGVLILYMEDLIGDEGMEYSEFANQLAPNIIFKDSTIKTPVSCEFMIWDKRSENSIKASVSLNLK